MYFERLEIINFGPFSTMNLDFQPKGLHVSIGENGRERHQSWVRYYLRLWEGVV